MSPISLLTEPTGWLIETKNTAYIVALSSSNIPCQAYWGARLPRKEDYWLTHRSENHAFAPLRTDEFPVWGDYQFVEPCLKVRFADGVRGGELYFQQAGVEGDRLTLTLRDPVYPLVVELHYHAVPDCDVIVRHALIQNNGDVPIALERMMSAAWHFPHRDSYLLYSLAGKWAAEFQIQQTPVTLGKHVIERRTGSTGFANTPWFALAVGANTSETCGEVWFGALAFSGNYKLILEHTADGRVAMTGGISDFDLVWLLEAGEQVVLPAFVGGYTREGLGAASRSLHGYVIDHVLPRESAQQPRPTVYNSWYVTGFNVNEENQSRAAEAAAELGIEYFVMDDGWFGARDSDRAGLGDWKVSRLKFPNGLKPLIDRVKSLGMQFGLWVEPEMVNPDSDLYRAHPDWVYHFPTRPRTTGRNQLILNMAREDVRTYIFDALNALLSEYDIRFLKWDMNRHFSEPGWHDAPPGRDREIWVRHTTSLYDLLARLRAKHPDVIFESCSGGGGRVDLGMLAFVEQVWMSDNTDALDDLRIQEGFSLAYPPRTRMAWVTDNLGFNAHRPIPLEFRFHVAMMGALGIGADLTKWSNEERAQARSLIALYKQIRPIVQLGDLYRLRSPRLHTVSAQQFVTRDREQSVVFIFLHSSRCGAQPLMLPLQGLDAEGLYEVRIQGQAQPIGSFSGYALMNQGIEVILHGDYVSRLIYVQKLGRV